MTDGVKTRARKALETQRAQEDNFWPHRLVTDMLSALEAAETQLQSWVEVAGSRQGLVDQLKSEKRTLQSEIDYLKGKRKLYCRKCGGAFAGTHDCGRDRS